MISVRAVIAVTLVLVTSGQAHGRTKKHHPRRAPSAKAAKASPTPPVAAEPIATSAETLLAAARAHMDALDYDKTVDDSRAVLFRTDVSTDQRAEALLLLGSALAVIGDPTDADEPFRELLNINPSARLPDDAPPKVVAAFVRVQVDVRERLRDQLEQQRKALIASMSIRADMPEHPVGGAPLSFGFTLRDPSKSVDAVQLRFKKRPEPDYSSIPLVPQSDGETWNGDLSAAYTENTSGLDVLWYVTSADAHGDALVSMGSVMDPGVLHVAPGVVYRERAFYRTWWFWGAVAVGAAAIGTTVYLVYEKHRSVPRSDLGAFTVP